MKKGFTLVELISVIALIAVITGVASVSYVTIKNKQKKDACIAFKKQLLNAAIETGQELNKCRWTDVYVSMQEIVDYGYFKEEDLIDPMTGNNIPLDKKIYLRCNNGNITPEFNSYSYQFDC